MDNELNKRLHEALGHQWHQCYPKPPTPEPRLCYACTCGLVFGFEPGIIEHLRRSNPDYVADPRLVLREMMKREDWDEFCGCMSGIKVIEIDYILDETGKLAKLALDWLERGE